MALDSARIRSVRARRAVGSATASTPGVGRVMANGFGSGFGSRRRRGGHGQRIGGVVEQGVRRHFQHLGQTHQRAGGNAVAALLILLQLLKTDAQGRGTAFLGEPTGTPDAADALADAGMKQGVGIGKCAGARRWMRRPCIIGPCIPGPCIIGPCIFGHGRAGTVQAAGAGVHVGLSLGWIVALSVAQRVHAARITRMAPHGSQDATMLRD
ncbi:hypothetical protein P7L64_24840 [Tistrella bauzanensis]|nr:hypothetical protein [Tistrella bauzanensis]